ncbi:MAG TPA: heavy metal translocating P-type ATPase metal-binding domain-containing protein, partial [Pseudomonadales bacterium]|nr:heavy metal translocating P-type ATPase metal-binding domain-containing protein [Pseudomonadales bacterium]
MKNHSSPTCFHCGEMLRGETSFALNLFDKTEFFCCKACMFAAETIVKGGLSQYYLSRTHAISTVSSANLLNQAESSYFDDANNLNDFSTSTSSNERSVSLAVEGIHCAACGWLIKNRLLLLNGITSIEVNLGSYQAHLRWQPDKIPLSRILNHLAELGYKARPLWLLDQNNDSEKQH